MRFEFFDANTRVGTVPDRNPRHFYTADELLEHMDAFGVAEAMVWHAWAVRWDWKRGNSALMDEIAGHERLHPVWVVGHHYTGQMPPGPELVERLLESGIRMVRLFIGTWGSSNVYIPAAYETLLGALAEARMPVLIEWENATPAWVDLAHICSTYPTLPVILTHPKIGQWERDWYPLLGEFPNFHIETAGYQAWRGFEGLVRLFGPKQIIFGSRAPVYQIGQGMSMIARSLVSVEDRQAMAAGNLRRLLSEVVC